jgi:hypothetical protein
MPPRFPSEYPVFWVTAALLSGALAFRWRALDEPGARLVAIALAMLPLGLTSARNVPVFMLVAVPAVSHLLTAKLEAPRRYRPRENEVANAIVLSVAVLTASAFVARLWASPPDRLYWTPIAPAAMSAVAACPGRIYNNYEMGGILIWFVPQQPVFIDSRYDPYPPELFHSVVEVERSVNYRSLFEKHGVTCAVVQAGTQMDRALRSDPRWVTTYADRALVVLMIARGETADAQTGQSGSFASSFEPSRVNATNHAPSAMVDAWKPAAANGTPHSGEK